MAANKASKGRGSVSAVKVKRAGVSNGGPKKTFARPTFSREKKNNTCLKKIMCPISILVVPFHESVFNQDLLQLVNGLLRDGSVAHQVDIGTGLRVMRELPDKKTKNASFQVIVPNLRENISVILDAAKVADVLLCVFPPEATYEDSCFDPLGYRTLTALRLQGLPALTVGTVINSQGSKIGSKTVQRYFFSEFSSDKAKFVLPCADAARGIAVQVAQVISSAFSGSLSSTSSAEKVRGHMLVEEIHTNGSPQVMIKGFAKGKGFGVMTGVVLTGCAETLRVAKIEILDPNSDMEEILETIVPCQSQVEETLKALQPLLPMEMQEQTWPTLEEEMEAEAARFAAVKMKRVLVPAGANSDMEAAWLGEDMIQEDHEEIVEEEEEEDSLMSRMFDWDKENVKEEEGKFEARTREEMDFIDEVDTPENVPARVRFQKYRGLKSLKNGDWDPYEELPAEYSQIHEFQDSAWATRQSLAFLEKSGSLCKNKYAKIYLETVSGNNVDLTTMQSAPLVASTVAPFECKMTVVHCRVNRVTAEDNVVAGFPEIKNKEKILVQCGFRRFTVSPLFSEIPKQASSVLQRMHRTLPADTGANVMMSFYAPAMFGHNPVLAFDASEKLLLWGSVSSCAPNKPIVLKRSTLTGYPFRVHQTKAVCRFMFFFPEDIEWFKPIELSTKKGLRGHIMESLGTHGYMKCRFNGQLTSDDVIFMHLYKRVFPKAS